MLEKKKFNGKVLIFPLLEIDFLKTSINLREADVLVVTSVYALEKVKMELRSFEKPIFAVGQRCDELLKELGVTNTFIYSNVKHLLSSFKNHFRNKCPLVVLLARQRNILRLEGRPFESRF